MTTVRVDVKDVNVNVVEREKGKNECERRAGRQKESESM